MAATALSKRDILRLFDLLGAELAATAADGEVANSRT